MNSTNKPLQVHLNGNTYDVLRRKIPGRNIGHCDPPDEPRPQIILDERLSGYIELDTFIHECLHGCCFDWMDEDFVNDRATELAKAIWDFYEWRMAHGEAD